MRKILSLLIAVLFGSITHLNANAGLTVGFSNTDSTSIFSVDVGDTFALSVFLSETPPDTILSTDGLIAMGLRATFNPALVDVSGIVVNPSFGLLPSQSFDNTAGIFQFSGSTFTPVAGSNVLLATVSVVVTAAGDTDFVFSDLDNGLADFGALTNGNLDPTIFTSSLGGTYTARITAVPEPSSTVALVMLVIAGGFLRQRRCRREPDFPDSQSSQW